MSTTEKTIRNAQIVRDVNEYGVSVEQAAINSGVSEGTVYRVLREYRNLQVQADQEIIDENHRLAAGRQYQMDRNRIERKAFRETIRVQNVAQELSDKLNERLDTFQFSKAPEPRHEGRAPRYGVIQFSDCHINEIVRGLTGNEFDIEIASKRIRKHVERSIRIFDAYEVNHVLVAFTGDILNSDRRLDEVLNAAAPRANAILLAVDIFQQAIQHLAQDFEVTVASITGNESRIGEHIHWDDFLALDSFDITIHNMLKRLFLNYPGVKFIPIGNPLESVVNLGGFNLLLVHGHGHKGLARNPENEVSHIKSRYASHGVTIDYVICGHIHSAYVSDMFSRSSGLPGSNAYSDRALNLNGRSSQNCYVVHEDKSIDAFKIDLQVVADQPGYEYDQTLEVKDKNIKLRPSVVINSITI